MIHRRGEGEKSRQGINWTWDKFSHPILLFKFGRVVLYARRRSKFVMSEGNKQRYIFDAGVISKPNLSILPWKRFDF